MTVFSYLNGSLFVLLLFYSILCYYFNNAYSTINELLVLQRDGCTCKIDLSSVTTNTTSLIQSLGFVGDAYDIYTVDNADYKYWEFDISGKTAKGVSTSTSTVTSNEHWFMNTLEELNMGEPN